MLNFFSNHTDFDLAKARAGHPIKTRSGSPMKFVAFVPDAAPQSRLVVLNPEDGEVLTFWDDGVFGFKREPSTLDLVTS